MSTVRPGASDSGPRLQGVYGKRAQVCVEGRRYFKLSDCNPLP